MAITFSISFDDALFSNFFSKKINKKKDVSDDAIPSEDWEGNFFSVVDEKSGEKFGDLSIKFDLSQYKGDQNSTSEKIEMASNAEPEPRIQCQLESLENHLQSSSQSPGLKSQSPSNKQKNEIKIEADLDMEEEQASFHEPASFVEKVTPLNLVAEESQNREEFSVFATTQSLQRSCQNEETDTYQQFCLSKRSPAKTSIESDFESRNLINNIGSNNVAPLATKIRSDKLQSSTENSPYGLGHELISSYHETAPTAGKETSFIDRELIQVLTRWQNQDPNREENCTHILRDSNEALPITTSQTSSPSSSGAASLPQRCPSYRKIKPNAKKVDRSQIVVNAYSSRHHPASYSSRSLEFACPTCEFRTRKNSYLLNHIRRNHLGIQVGCMLCSYSTKWKQTMKLHYMKKHKLGEEETKFMLDNAVFHPPAKDIQR